MTGHTNAQLTNRCAFVVEGEDTLPFLQGLLTNDVYQLSEENPVIHGAFLTPHGRFLTDVFFVQTGINTYILDILSVYADDIIIKLKRFILRSRVTLKDNTRYHVYTAPLDVMPPADCVCVTDPRLKDYQRFYSLFPLTITQDYTAAYRQHCIKQIIPPDYGIIPHGRGFIMDYGFHESDSVSLTKGCYVGQELVARMYHTRMGKKCLASVIGAVKTPCPPPPSDTIIATLLDHEGDHLLMHMNHTDLSQHTTPFYCDTLTLCDKMENNFMIHNHYIHFKKNSYTL